PRSLRPRGAGPRGRPERPRGAPPERPPAAPAAALARGAPLRRLRAPGDGHRRGAPAPAHGALTTASRAREGARPARPRRPAHLDAPGRVHLGPGGPGTLRR